MDIDEDEQELCEYERKRLQNIKRNHEFLRSLGKFKLACAWNGNTGGESLGVY